jgi:hypothetical protein
LVDDSNWRTAPRWHRNRLRSKEIRDTYFWYNSENKFGQKDFNVIKVLKIEIKRLSTVIRISNSW